MAATFASLQTRVNDAVARHLADVTADFGAGRLVDGLFVAPYAEAFGGIVSGCQPAFEAGATALAGIASGTTVTIGGTAYIVTVVHPDASGWVRLDLDRV